jgi:hypothetical protein
MKTIFTFSKVGSLRLTAISLLTILALGYGYQSSTKTAKDLVNLHEGVSTCAHRSNQTFTAKMVGDKSSVYLQNDFMNITEDCYADTIASFNGNLAHKMNLVGNQLNKLATDTHQFHEKVLMAATTPAELSGQFEKLEAQRNAIIDEVENSGIKNSGTEDIVIISLIVSFLLLSLVVVKNQWQNVQEANLNSKMDDEARELLSSQDENKEEQIENLIETFFAANKQTFLSQIFYAYKTNMKDRLIVAKENQVNAFMAKPVVIEPVQVQETRVQENTIVPGTVNLSETISKVINLLSGKAFSHGVILDFDLSETFFVRGNEEAISQVIFNLISHSINNNLNNTNGKRIKAEIKVVGENILFKLIDNSQIYTNELVMEVNGSLNQVNDIGLAVCKEFVSELKGDLHAKNVYDHNGNVAQTVTELMLQRATEATASVSHQPKLVNYVKGKKRDLRRRQKQFQRQNQLEA